MRTPTLSQFVESVLTCNGMEHLVDMDSQPGRIVIRITGHVVAGMEMESRALLLHKITGRLTDMGLSVMPADDHLEVTRR